MALQLSFWTGDFSIDLFLRYPMVVATRTLTLRQGNTDKEIAIRIFAPEQYEPRAWSCQYEIDWPEGTRRFAAHGVDSVQALLLALKMIGAEIYTSDYHKSGKLFSEAPGRGYGFPVANTLRDLLEGDDAKYL
jgi:hypothetical protein